VSLEKEITNYPSCFFVGNTWSCSTAIDTQARTLQIHHLSLIMTCKYQRQHGLGNKKYVLAAITNKK